MEPESTEQPKMEESAEGVDLQSSLMLDTPEKQSFFDELTHHWQRRGEVINIPIMGFKALDLYTLFHETVAAGGYDQIAENEAAWQEIWRRMHNYRPTISNAVVRLRQYYVKLLLDYENEIRQPKVLRRVQFQFSDGRSLPADLYDTATGHAVSRALPLSGRVETFGELFYFEVHDRSKSLHVNKESDARDIVNVGEIALWCESPSILVGFGKTRCSTGDEIRLLTKCNVFGRVRAPVEDMRKVSEGLGVSIIPLDPTPTIPQPPPPPQQQQPTGGVPTSASAAPTASVATPTSSGRGKRRKRESEPTTEEQQQQEGGMMTRHQLQQQQEAARRIPYMAPTNVAAPAEKPDACKLSIKYKWAHEGDDMSRLLVRYLPEGKITPKHILRFLNQDRVDLEDLNEIRVFNQDSTPESSGWVLLTDEWKCNDPEMRDGGSVIVRVLLK